MKYHSKWQQMRYLRRSSEKRTAAKAARSEGSNMLTFILGVVTGVLLTTLGMLIVVSGDVYDDGVREDEE